MADRIEYQGDTLPTGLPGFGDASVSVLTLPGFNRVVAVQAFGPVVEASNVIPPSPTPPPGSNPEEPTTQVVPAGPAPSSNAASFNFCEQCVPPESDADNFPLLFGKPVESSCRDCQGERPGRTTWFDTASNGEDGMFLYEGIGGIKGIVGEKTWSIKQTELKLDGNIGGVILNEAQLALALGSLSETFYQAGPTIQGPDGKEYRPHDLEVCEGGETKTWRVLAYKPA